MNRLTEKMFEIAPYGYFTSQDVVALFPESHDQRYSLVKRAIAGGEIIHIRRGLYCLAPKYQKKRSIYTHWLNISTDLHTSAWNQH